MKPVLILQNLSADGPAYLGTWLQREGQAFDVFDAEAGAVCPERIDGYGALALLGGEMSANDDLPSLRQAERLILQAMGNGVPVIGHCLGGQLMARALGVAVEPSPQPEIGWSTIDVAATPEARRWFGAASRRAVFQWHGESFGVPPGASRLAGNAACPNQAFAIGPHLALQFHVELDLAKLERWSASVDPGYRRLQRECPDTVQSGARMRSAAAEALPAQQALADALYRHWLSGAAP